MRILVTGASGQLGGYLLRELADTDASAWSGSRTGELFGRPLQPVDLADAEGVARAFRHARPAVVIHAAAVSSVADCHRDPDRARRVNSAGSALLADLCADIGARMVYVSTDMVFDGATGSYTEQDQPSPLSVYGRRKLDAEAAVLSRPRTSVVRVSLLFGPSLTGRTSFFDQQVQALQSGKPITCFEDEWRTPLALHTAARALVAIARSDHEELLHLGGPERLSRLEMGLRLADFLGADRQLILAGSREGTAPEPRPRDTSLDSGRWRRRFPDQPWPSWDEALTEMGLR